MDAQLDAGAVDVRLVKALGHPTRLRILTILRDRELASPVELSGELGLALGTVGYHVRRLEQLGFIELATRTQRRGAIEHHYRARAVLDGIGGDDPPAEPLRSGEGGAQAAAVIRAAQAALPVGGFDAVPARVAQRIVVLDRRGEAALARTLPRWQTRIQRIASASAARLAAEQSTARRGVVVLMRFELAPRPAGGAR